MEKWFRIIQSKMKLLGIIIATMMLLIIEISLVHLFYATDNEQDEINKENNNTIATGNSNVSNSDDIETIDNPNDLNNNVETNDNTSGLNNNATISNNSTDFNNGGTTNNNTGNPNNSGTANNNSSNTNNGTNSNNSSNSNNSGTISSNSSNTNNGTSNNNSSNSNNSGITNNNNNNAATTVTYNSPSISIYTGNGTTTKYSDYTLEYSVSNVYDNAKIIIKNNNNVISQKTVTSSSTLKEKIVLTEGNNNIEIIATNSAGKTSSKSITVVYTISSPKVWIDSSSGNTTRYSSYNFSYSFQDIYNSGVNVVIKVNGSVAKELYGITAPSSVTVTLSEGENKIEVIVTNQKGKSGSATKTVTYNK